MKLLFNSALNSLFSPLHDDGLRTSLSEVGGGEESMQCYYALRSRRSRGVSHELVDIIRQIPLGRAIENRRYSNLEA